MIGGVVHAELKSAPPQVPLSPTRMEESPAQPTCCTSVSANFDVTTLVESFSNGVHPFLARQSDVAT
jgi:hypothetical protein